LWFKLRPLQGHFGGGGVLHNNIRHGARRPGLGKLLGTERKKRDRTKGLKNREKKKEREKEISIRVGITQKGKRPRGVTGGAMKKEHKGTARN